MAMVEHTAYKSKVSSIVYLVVVEEP